MGPKIFACTRPVRPAVRTVFFCSMLGIASLSASESPLLYEATSLPDRKAVEDFVRRLADDAGNSTMKKRLARGIAWHTLVSTEPESYIHLVRQELENLDDPVARAYVGSTLTVEARVLKENGKPLKALKLLRQGIGEIDQAKQEAPDNPFIRILRLVNGIEVSATSPVNRLKAIQDDAEFVVNILAADTSRAAERRSEYYFYGGWYYESIGSQEISAGYYRMSLTLAPGSKWGTAAAKRLNVGNR